jgi:hypothetical protein
MKRRKPAESRALNWNDPDARRLWLSRIDSDVADLLAAMEDQLAPVNDRQLGRAALRRIFDESSANLEELLSYAGRGLDADEHGDPSGSGDAGPN